MTRTELGGWLQQAHSRLKGLSEQPGLEAQALAAFALGKPRAWLLAHPEFELAATDCQRLERLLARLLEGEPLAYLTGEQEFYGRRFAVSPAVLIPRPETELLVDEALRWLRDQPGQRRAADVGTGSGCIAVTLAAEVADLSVTAVDRSAEALAVARRNADTNGVSERIDFRQGNLLHGVTDQFDLVCANLPYIPSRTLAGLAVRRYEPTLALDGGPDGTELIEALLRDADRWLAQPGLLLLEIEAGQGERVPALAQRWLADAEVRLLPDWVGLPRLVRVERRQDGEQSGDFSQ